MSKPAQETKTSADWLKAIQAETGDTIIVMDPDGWDRTNYNFSFNEEEITRAEFDFRLGESTVMYRAAEPVQLSKAS